MFDSLYLPSGEHVASLMKQGRVIHWVREAFGHCKAIGATGEGVALVKMACEIEGMIFSAGDSGEVVDSYGVVTAAGVGTPTGITEALKMVKGAKTFLEAYAFNISQHRNFKRELDGLTSMVAY
jgi:catalase